MSAKKTWYQTGETTHSSYSSLVTILDNFDGALSLHLVLKALYGLLRHVADKQRRLRADLRTKIDSHWIAHDTKA